MSEIIPEVRGRDEFPGLTVGQLRAAMEGMPDEWPVRVDTGIGADMSAYWYMDKHKTVRPESRVRIIGIRTSGTGKFVLEL